MSGKVRSWVRHEVSNLRGALDGFQKDDGSLMAAAVAYYVGLSFFPMLLVLIAGVGLFLKYSHSGQNAEEQIFAVLAEHLSPSLKSNVSEALTQVQDKSVVSGPIGTIGILLAAMAAFVQFEAAFNKIWNVPEPKSGGIVKSILRTLATRGLAFLMLLGAGLLIIVIFLAGLAMNTVAAVANDFLPIPAAAWNLSQVCLTVTLNALVFGCIYRWLPRVPVRWKEAFRGGVVAAILWEVGRGILATFLIGNKYSSAYGVVGSFIAILLWCYYAVTVLFIGAEYVQQVCGACSGGGEGVEPDPEGAVRDPAISERAAARDEVLVVSTRRGPEAHTPA